MPFVTSSICTRYEDTWLKFCLRTSIGGQLTPARRLLLYVPTVMVQKDQIKDVALIHIGCTNLLHHRWHQCEGISMANTSSQFIKVLVAGLILIRMSAGVEE